MRKLLSLLLLLSLLITPVFAHPGRTDENGGHWDRSTGEYHYHHGYSAHQHYDMDGDGIPDCPYDFRDNTSHSSSGSSSSTATTAYSVTVTPKKSSTETTAAASVSSQPSGKKETGSYAGWIVSAVLVLALIRSSKSHQQEQSSLRHQLGKQLDEQSQTIQDLNDEIKVRESAFVVIKNNTDQKYAELLKEKTKCEHNYEEVKRELENLHAVLEKEKENANQRYAELLKEKSECEQNYEEVQSELKAIYAISEKEKENADQKCAELLKKKSECERNYEEAQSKLDTIYAVSEKEDGQTDKEQITSLSVKVCTLEDELESKESMIQELSYELDKHIRRERIPPKVYIGDDGLPVLLKAPTEKYGDYTAYLNTRTKIYHMDSLCAPYYAKAVHLFNVPESYRPCSKCAANTSRIVPDWYRKL